MPPGMTSTRMVLSELIVVGEWLPISVYAVENGQLQDKTGDFFEKAYRGWWNTIEVTDLNNDQIPDLVLGNMGTNAQFSVSDKEPAELYYKDFDNNGAIDRIF